MTTSPHAHPPAQDPAPQDAPRRRPRADQQAGIAAAARQLRRAGSRATVVSACGTGKTLIGIRVAEEVGSRRVMVVLPTKDLAVQTALAWRADRRREPMVLISSMDATASASLQAANVGSTGDFTRLASLMKSVEQLTVFVLYDSLRKITEAQQALHAPAFDLAIMDEAHRISGHHDKQWATVLDNQHIKADRRLFLTATPRIWDSPDLAEDPDNPHRPRPRRRRTTVQRAPIDPRLINSLDNTHLYGPTVHHYPLHQAVEDGVIADYRILVPTITDTHLHQRLHTDTTTAASTRAGSAPTTGTRPGNAQTDDMRTGNAKPGGSPAGSALRTTALHLAVHKAMTEHQLHHVLVYFNEVATARDFTREYPHTLRRLPPELRPATMPSVLHINGDDLPDERQATLNAFTAAPAAILTNAKVLTEGIDSGAIDAVVIADTTRSVVRCVQALGRALRKPAGADKLAHLIIPAYIPEGADPTDILGTPYEPVWAIATALRSHDHRIAERLPNRANRLPGEVRELVRRRWRFDYDTHPEVIARAMDLVSFDPARISTRPRLKGLASAQAYRDEHGHLAVPHEYVDPYGFTLGEFVSGQRSAHQRGELPPEWIAELDALGMIWSVPDAQWQANLTTVTAYHQQTGHLAIPTTDPGGRFLAEQRAQAARGQLAPERTADLENIDPHWRLLHGPDWHRKYATLRTHLRAGHDPAELHPDSVLVGIRIGPWLQRQTTGWAKLHPDQQRLLTEIGLTPASSPLPRLARTRRTFRQNTDLLEAFLVREEGRLPEARESIIVDGEKIAIGAWLAKARSRARSGALRAEDRATITGLLGEEWAAAPDTA
ncbi:MULTISPECIES: DEAD/DEAH box helicase [Kitasatospora]|uniref:DEAD/DEAH box helicase n=2 Tax=Streptomycetaceae TaxID=2062 RepID=UPI000D0A9881|nr:DEAD/DEAH box helicase [Kitasatospora setae]